MSFTQSIGPFVRAELDRAAALFGEGDSRSSFRHLENAHVLGQSSTKWHTLAHIQMLRWAICERDVREILGQLFRIIGAITKTAFGLVPQGNTGGSNVSPFKPMPIDPELARILAKASSNST